MSWIFSAALRPDTGRTASKLFKAAGRRSAGAIYACLMPIAGILDFLPLSFLPCVMAVIAFASKAQRGFWTPALIFIGGTLLAGGAAMGLTYLFNADMLAVPGGFLLQAGFQAV